MKVTVLASTSITQDLPESVQDTDFERRIFAGDDSTEIDLLAEFAGRACYQSWELPNSATAKNETYLRNIVRQQHFSVLEHGYVTFYVEGVSRSLTHELIRHRHLSYSELSQRYVNVEDTPVVNPPAIMDSVARLSAEDGDLINWDLNESVAVQQSKKLYSFTIDRLSIAGFSHKEAREAARAVMPGGLETKIVVTGNLRAWRDMLYKRWTKAADAEMRLFAGEVLKHLRRLAPSSVQDIPTSPM